MENSTNNIFINNKIWNTFTESELEDYVEQVFQYYRTKGFPFFDMSLPDRYLQFIKLRNYDPSVLYKRDINSDLNILTQDTQFLNLANYYFKNMWNVKNGSYRTPLEVFYNDELLKKAIKKRIKYGTNISDGAIRKVLCWFQGTYRVSNFKPTIAKYFYDNYSGSGVVLDPSSGYGSRLITALSSKHVKKYIGIDPCLETYNGLIQIKTDFDTDNKSILYKIPFENYIHNFEPVDLIFSSPPYFNTEKYDSEMNQSYLKFPTKELWTNGFLKIYIENSYNFLKKDGYFILNIADVKTYKDLVQVSMNLAIKSGFTWVKTYQMALSARNSVGFRYEPIMVFIKRN